MIQTLTKILLLGLAVESAILGKMRRLDHGRSNRPDANSSPSSVRINLLQNLSNLKKANATKQDTITTQNTTAFEEIKHKLKQDLKTIVEKADVCRKRYPNMSNQTFSIKLYNVLMDEIMGTNRSSNFRCALNKKIVDDVKDKLHQLEDFQKGFARSSKNNSTKSPGQTTAKKPTGFVGVNVERGLENNLKLKSEEELRTKVPYNSHIYLGSSLFPFFTEESRILDKAHTIPSPVVTKRPQQDKLHEKETNLGTVAKVYKLLTPFRWNKNIRTETDESRLSRSIQVSEWMSERGELIATVSSDLRQTTGKN